MALTRKRLAALAAAVSRTPPAQDQAMPDLFAYMARNGDFYRLLYRRELPLDVGVSLRVVHDVTVTPFL